VIEGKGFQKTNLDLEGVTGERVVLVEEVGGRFAAANILKRSAE